MIGMYTNNTKQHWGAWAYFEIIQLYVSQLKNWRWLPFQNLTVATWPLLSCLPCLRAEDRMTEGLLLNLISFFQCGKCYLGRGALIFVICILYLAMMPEKMNLSASLSLCFWGKELEKCRRAVRSLTAHLAPSAFVPEQKRPAPVIRV